MPPATRTPGWRCPNPTRTQRIPGASGHAGVHFTQTPLFLTTAAFTRKSSRPFVVFIVRVGPLQCRETGPTSTGRTRFNGSEPRTAAPTNQETGTLLRALERELRHEATSDRRALCVRPDLMLWQAVPPTACVPVAAFDAAASRRRRRRRTLRLTAWRRRAYRIFRKVLHALPVAAGRAFAALELPAALLIVKDKKRR